MSSLHFLVVYTKETRSNLALTVTDLEQQAPLPRHLIHTEPDTAKLRAFLCLASLFTSLLNSVHSCQCSSDVHSRSYFS
jgi:hypothetical protein